MMKEELERLEQKIETISNLGQVQGILNWDQEVMMPEKGIKARSKQKSSISRIVHELWTEEELKGLIENLKGSDLSERETALLREVERSHERAEKVPKDLLEKISEKESENAEAWKKAKKESDFNIFASDLQEMVELKRRYAEHIDPDKEPYEVLFRDYEPYIEFETVQQILEKLRNELTIIIERIREKETDIETDTFKGEFSTDKQEEFNRDLVEELGFEKDRGRLDISEHPFTSGNRFDCRITTRYSSEDLSKGILPTMHECGHALYQLGLPGDEYGNPLGEARDLSVHESQSRLWENHVGRSREFWTYMLPELKQSFPEQFKDVTVEECYESVNQVYTDNPVRVEADELTYHLHIVLRFEIGRKLINGDIEVDELPELWNRKMEEYLGFRPKNDAEGVLQDIHWAWGNFGYFPTYSLGSVLAAQIYRKAEEEIEDLDRKIEKGEFEPLLEWLRENVHSHGKRYRTEQLIENVAGRKPSAEPFLEYIESKYSEIYGL